MRRIGFWGKLECSHDKEPREYHQEFVRDSIFSSIRNTATHGARAPAVLVDRGFRVWETEIRVSRLFLMNVEIGLKQTSRFENSRVYGIKHPVGARRLRRFRIAPIMPWLANISL